MTETVKWTREYEAAREATIERIAKIIDPMAFEPPGEESSRDTARLRLKRQKTAKAKAADIMIEVSQ